MYSFERQRTDFRGLRSPCMKPFACMYSSASPMCFPMCRTCLYMSKCIRMWLCMLRTC